MAGSGQTQALLDRLDSQQKLQRLIALERLSEACQHGFSTDELELMLKKVSTIKGGVFMGVQLLDCCLPAGEVSEAIIDRAVYVMASPHTSSTLKKAMLGWLLAGVQHFFSPAALRHLRTHYGVIFSQINWSNMGGLACTLIHRITEHSDVLQHRADMLLTRSAAAAADNGPRRALIRKYRQLRQDMVQSHAADAGGPTRWEKPRAQLMANVARWRQRRDAAGAPGGAAEAAGAGGDGSGDFWDMAGGKSSRRRAPALPVLPESVPSAPGGGGGGAGAADAPGLAGRHLSSLGSLREVVTEAAVGFRAANNLTALALSSERRAVLLLSDTRELDTSKMSMDLLVTLRQMLVYDPRRYSGPARRQLIHQLEMCHRVGLPLSAGRHLMRALLEGARPEHSDVWLPALDLVPFYGWRPQAVMQQALLQPLEKLAAAADRHVRLHVLHVLTEFVVRLARHELPLVTRAAFPYSSDTCRDEISSSSDPAADVARITEHVAGMCKRLSMSAPAGERLNLMRATVHFYTEVTPVLLDAGVPYLPPMGKDLVYQVLLSADAVAVHKLLLMFSRYRLQSARLVAMQADPALSRVRVKLAAATASRLQALTSLMEDLLLLVFGIRKGAGGQFKDHTPEVRAKLGALRDNMELDLESHPALLGYQVLAEERDEVPMGGDQFQQLLLDLLSADGLVGFTAFKDACTVPAGRRQPGKRRAAPRD